VSTPALSIVMPTYNRGHIIGRSITSIQAQTVPDWELVVVDDGSSDETIAVVEGFVRDDARIRLVANAGRAGPAGARNTGIRVSRAGTVAFLDSDDRWDPKKLEAFLLARQHEPSAGLIGSDYRMVDETNGSAETMKSYLFNTILPWWESYPLAAAVIPVDQIRHDVHVITRPQVFLSMALAGFLWIQTSSAIVRRDAALRAGLFDERLTRTEDIDLWLKLSRLGPVVYLDEVLATYDITGRKHGTGTRYDSYHQSRRHSHYTEALYHLRSLKRIAKTNPLDAEQWRLARHRRIAHHQHCAIAGLQERRLRGFAHLLICLTAKEQREQLIRQPDMFFRRP
jgi:glycosyltransferase involved in cell wall biosynthesis